MAAVIRFLTPRESEVARLVVAGKRSREIAEALGISAGTVNKHRSNIMLALHCRNAVELTQYARRGGWA